jgi:hypothetical protein
MKIKPVEIKTTKSVVAGMNIMLCDCGNPAFMPVSMDLLAYLKVHGPKEIEGRCTDGHTVKMRAMGGMLRSTEDEYEQRESSEAL